MDARNLYITAAHGDISVAKKLVRGNRAHVKHVRYAIFSLECVPLSRSVSTES